MEHRYDLNLAQALMGAAIRIFKSEAKLGAATGYSQNAIWHAKRTGRVSAEMAVAVDRATDGQIPKSALRPDLFGRVATVDIEKLSTSDISHSRHHIPPLIADQVT